MFGSKYLAIKQRIAFDAVVRLFYPGVGVMDGAHAETAATRQNHASAETILEVEGRAHIPLTDIGFREQRNPDSELHEGLETLPMELIDEYRTE